jgi:hypothetical protein
MKRVDLQCGTVSISNPQTNKTMSVNYTLLDLEQALMEHPFGLTESELWDYQQFYTDFWESNLYCEDLEPLDELVEEFLGWLSDGEKSFQNKEKFEQHMVESYNSCIFDL